MKEFSFEKLAVWNDAKLFCISMYSMSQSFPYEEKYGIKSQLRRAAISICTNIAEGTSRMTNPDRRRFIQLAYGSLMESLSLLIIASELGFISKSDYLPQRTQIENISYKLTSLRNAFT